MKHKKFLLIALICLIGIGISFLLFSAHRPFKDLEAADITSASVRLSPPDTTIQIVETEELVSYLNEVVIYDGTVLLCDTGEKYVNYRIEQRK